MLHHTPLRLVLSIAAVVASVRVQPSGPAIWAGLHAGPHPVGVARAVRDDLEVTYWYPSQRGGRMVRLKDLSAQAEAFVDGLIRDQMPPGLAKAYGESPLYAHGRTARGGSLPACADRAGQRPGAS